MTFPLPRRPGHHVGQKVGSRDNALPRRAGERYGSGWSRLFGMEAKHE